MVFKSNYVKNRYCLGFKLPKDVAIRAASLLNLKYNLGQSRYQVLVNEGTIRFDEDYNLIITHPDRDKLDIITIILQKHKIV